MRFSFTIYTNLHISSSSTVFPTLKAGKLILEICYTYVESSKIDIHENTNADRRIEKEPETTRPVLF